MIFMKDVFGIRMTVIMVMLITGFTFAFASGKAEEPPESDVMTESDMIMDSGSMTELELIEGAETAVLAGGCFWGVEAVFERLDGVLDVVSGYSGGEANTAHYKMVGTGSTGHAEAVSIVYDPQNISFETLLKVFFTVAHDPTQLNYQGPDVGSEYRSVVFFTDEKQKMITEEFITGLEEEGVYDDPVVTELLPLDAFYPAEDYHQDFMRLNPRHPYIVYWDIPKVEHLEEMYPELLKDM